MNVLTRPTLSRKVSQKALIAEGAVVDAIVICQAIVDAVVKTTSNTKQVTLGTFRLAELDAGPEIYHCTVERPA
jgi:hypothetical protein